MKRIYICFFSLFVLVGFSQRQKDSIFFKKHRYGINLGVDLFKPAKSVLDSDYRGFEITGGYRLSEKIYFAVETGTENKTTNQTHINFTTEGIYLRAGVDFNLYENWLDMENHIYIGGRFATSFFSQRLNYYRIYYNTDGFLGEHTRVDLNREFSGLNAHWVELVGGVKAKIINNLFLGFSIRLNVLATDKKPDNFDNLYIPGFQRTYNGKIGVGFNYTVSYFIPIFRN